jgi:hypothetical protein
MRPQQEEQPERRLAAIFAADVEGYSRLMRADEVGTLRTLTAHREVMDRLIAEHRDDCLHEFGGSRYFWLRPSAPKAESSVRFIKDAWQRRVIDDPANLADDRCSTANRTRLCQKKWAAL